MNKLGTVHSMVLGAGLLLASEVPAQEENGQLKAKDSQKCELVFEQTGVNGIESPDPLNVIERTLVRLFAQDVGCKVFTILSGKLDYETPLEERNPKVDILGGKQVCTALKSEQLKAECSADYFVTPSTVLTNNKDASCDDLGRVGTIGYTAVAELLLRCVEQKLIHIDTIVNAKNYDELIELLITAQSKPKDDSRKINSILVSQTVADGLNLETHQLRKLDCETPGLQAGLYFSESSTINGAPAIEVYNEWARKNRNLVLQTLQDNGVAKDNLPDSVAFGGKK